MLELKSWPHFFQAIKAGDKKHDLRDARDKQYHVGQELKLREYDPWKGEYTGEFLYATVSFITSETTPCALSSAVLAHGFVILSLDQIEEGNKNAT